MIQRHRPIQFLVVAIILLFPFTAAWPWPPSVESREGLIYKRQDNSNTESRSTASSSSQPTNTQADKSATVSETGSQTKGTASATNTASASDSKVTTAQKTGSSKTSEEASKTTTKTSSIPLDEPPGGVVMITPAPNSPAEYYKIGDKVEFAWNYTQLLASPTAVNILVSCNANKAMYTISNNATFETSARVTWDTAQQTGPPSLLTDTYTLVIYDADTVMTAVPQPGHLAPFNQFRFGMYLRQTYVPKEQWVCATCSGAVSDMERQTLKLVFGMCALTILSFTWFVGGCNVWL